MSMYRLELLQMIGRGPFENTRTGEVFWLGPGVALPYLPGDTFGAPPSYAGAVLDAVGHEVERDLTWEWPTAYNGPQRRAAVRVRLEEQGRLRWRAAVSNPLAQMKISGITS